MHPETLVIATRTSRLALWQAGHVQTRLQALYPECRVSLLPLTTRGDEILDKTLAKIGDKGLFIKALEVALLDGRADLAVHSLKDVPPELDAEFALPVIMARTDAYDAFVSNTCDRLQALPVGAVVGTSSLRREAQLRARYPHLEIRPLRGNLDTRLRKLDDGEYDGMIVAAAGLQRLGLAARICEELPVDVCLPAAGQGAMAIETLAARTDLQQSLMPLACFDTSASCMAERTVSRVLGGSCQVPLAAYAQLQDGVLTVRALVSRPDGSCVIRAERRGAVQDALTLGAQVAQDLLVAGADALLADLAQTGDDAAP